MKAPFAFAFVQRTEEGRLFDVFNETGVVEGSDETASENAVMEKFAEFITQSMLDDGFIDDGEQTFVDYLNDCWFIEQSEFELLNIQWFNVEQGEWKKIDYHSPSLSAIVMALYRQKNNSLPPFEE